MSSRNPVLEVDRVLAAALTNITLQQEPTQETQTRAVTVEMGKRALRYSYFI
jgi:hypothetical protein